MNKTQSQSNTFSEYVPFLTHYLRPRLRWVLLLVVTLLVSIGLQLANPQIVRTFIDAAMAGGALRDLIITALLFLGVALARQAVSLAVTYLAQNVAWVATNALRLDLALHCLRLDLSFHKARTPGELIERVDGDVSELANFFSQMIVRLLGNSLLVLGILILLFREDWRVGLIGAAYVLLAAVLLRQVQKPATKAWSESRQAHAELFGFLGEKEEMRRLWAEQLYGDRAGNRIPRCPDVQSFGRENAELLEGYRMNPRDSKTPVIASGGKVVLRDRLPSDVDDFIRWQTHGEWREYDVPWESMRTTLTEEDQGQIRAKFLAEYAQGQPWPRRRATIATPENSPLGWVNRYADKRFPDAWLVGISIGEDAYLNHGIGTEALGLWIETLFSNSGVHRIGLEPWSFDPRMVRVAEKLGFVYEGTERELIEWQGEWLDRIHFGMLRREWEEEQQW